MDKGKKMHLGEKEKRFASRVFYVLDAFLGASAHIILIPTAALPSRYGCLTL